MRRPRPECRTEGTSIEKRTQGVSKSFRTGRLERERQMVQPSATKCSCIAILWVILVSFVAITICVARQRVSVVNFIIDWAQKLLHTLSYLCFPNAFSPFPTKFGSHSVSPFWLRAPDWDSWPYVSLLGTFLCFPSWRVDKSVIWEGGTVLCPYVLVASSSSSGLRTGRSITVCTTENTTESRSSITNTFHNVGYNNQRLC
jgi:hypothetical protein